LKRRGVFRNSHPELLRSNPFSHDLSLKLWLPFLPEVQSKIWDYSGNGNDGIIHGAAPSIHPPNVAGAGWNFDGVDDYIAIQNDIFSGNNEYLYINPGVAGTGKLSFYDAAIGWQSDTTPLQDDVWQNVGATLSGTALIFFINGAVNSTIAVTVGQPWTISAWINPNGILDAQSLLSRNDNWLSDPTLPAEYVGCRNGNQAYFNGVVGDVQVLKRAMASPEMFAYYALTRSRFGV
jgi:hypothetical protein